MEVLALTILILSGIIGLIAIFFTTFGTLIILIGALAYAFMTNFSVLTLKQLIIIFILYLVGEVLEYLFIIMGAKKLGASNAAAVGALIGGILGAVMGAASLGVGLIPGTFLGIFLGAFFVEFFIQGDLVRSLKAGTGGILGRVGSIIVKLMLAVFMLTIVALSIFKYHNF